MKNLSPAAYDVAMTPSDIFTVKYAFWMPPKISSTLPICRHSQLLVRDAKSRVSAETSMVTGTAPATDRPLHRD